jgi:peptidoglycan-associated lipoprotein
MMRTLVMALSLTFLLAAPVLAQQGSALQVGIAYNYLHTNAPPKGCGCFSMNGGNGSAAWRLSSRFALSGEIGVTRATNVTPDGDDLTLTNFLFGPRFYILSGTSQPEHFHHGLAPFAQVLAGGVHASGTLSGNSSGSSNGFAFAAGGGLDESLSRHIALRLFQPEYLYTHIPNGSNNHQNNFSISSGLVIRF